VAGTRVVRPGCTEAVIYNRSAPAPAEAAPYFGLIATDAVRIPFTVDSVSKLPVYPGASLDNSVGVIKTLDYEQGERDPNSVPLSLNLTRRLGPSHLPKFLKCVGNEVAIECYKYEIDSTTGAIIGPRAWEFLVDPVTHLPDPSCEDFYFSRLLGIAGAGIEETPPSDTGVRLITGDFPQ
jgi:hypothetical protein